jgi:hypothetical protein
VKAATKAKGMRRVVLKAGASVKGELLPVVMPVGAAGGAVELLKLGVGEVRENADRWFGAHVVDLRKSGEVLMGTPADGSEAATDKLKQLKLREEVREKQIASGLALFGRGAAAKEKPNITVDVTLIQKDGTVVASPVIDADEVVPENKPLPFLDKPVPVKVYDPFA